jgi:hypothetical protein
MGLLQGTPFGAHICGPQTPLMQALLQHWAGLAHMAPSGSQAHGLPQTEPTSVTQVESHVFTQQNGSIAQILPTHASHPPVSLGPTVHSLCEQLFVTPQMPFEHVPVQHGSVMLQGTPSGRHIGLPQMPLVQMLEQQGAVVEQSLPSGMHICGPQMPLLQMPEQQGPVQGTPFGRHCAPHSPLGPHVPEQHIAPTVHTLPSGSHWPQKPLVHAPLQH